MSLAVPRKSVLQQWFYEPEKEPVTFDDILMYLGKYKKIIPSFYFILHLIFLQVFTNFKENREICWKKLESDISFRNFNNFSIYLIILLPIFVNN